MMFADLSTTALSADGVLVRNGYEPFQTDLTEAIPRGEDVLQKFRLDGMSELGLRLKDGSILSTNY